MGIDTRKPSKLQITKGIVDTLIVLQHPITVLNITWPEIENIAFNEYFIDKNKKEPKISRTYKRVLEIDNYKPKLSLQRELSILAARIVKRAKAKYGEDYGVKFQTNRTKEEFIELARELDNYERFQSTKNSADYISRGDNDNRQKIIDEIFDVLYTIRYIMTAQNIKTKDIVKLFEIRFREAILIAESTRKKER